MLSRLDHLGVIFMLLIVELGGVDMKLLFMCLHAPTPVANGWILSLLGK